MRVGETGGDEGQGRREGMSTGLRAEKRTRRPKNHRSSWLPLPVSSLLSPHSLKQDHGVVPA